MRIPLTAAACLLTLAAYAQTTIRLTSVPATTPTDATLYIAGSFNDWDPGSAAYSLAKNTDGTYQITLPASITGKLEFKFTRGSWDKVETSAQQADVSNRTYTATGAPATVELQVANWKDLGGGSGGCASTALQPNVQVVNASFSIPQLGGRTRRIWIYLPVDYATSARRYPVLYMHDGQNVFDKCTSFSGEWGVDEALRQLQQSGQDPTGTIVVAVDNGGNSRLNEYSPWPNAEYKSGGEGDKYVDFLVETLKPYIDQQYRTLTGREYTGIAGSSMGGLISVYAALKYQNVFSKVGVFSPAFWFARQPLFDYVKTAGHQQPIKFYFLAGAKESETMVPLMAEMRDALQQQGFAAADMSYHVLEDGQHAEWFWQREFPAAFQWLYAGTPTAGKPQRPALAFSAYPSPAREQLTVQLPAPEKDAKVEILDTTGRLVLKGKVRNGATLDVSRLAKGRYLLRVQAGKASGTQSFIKE
ncbi:alpha/beta hydrolase-fold protein [Hymenobacter guriensis]|uniref:T9SS type A sorting domain-containing protein n=1 Tax=Hymenobacter guriensis TaxID=2793065 RepID=A0ABS0L455_9BACT|nr:alpha/beta hydrolase-fold protein [Hymenobacter guriensis]MBG8554902.1 T9SS type A sorting domain-containing protein [Hymenobacter guriensis]